MAKGYKVGAQSLKRIGAAVNAWESESKNSIQKTGGGRPGDQRWFNVYNDSGEDIPPYAIAALDSSSVPTNGGSIVRKVKKPSTTLQTQFCAIDGGGIKTGKNGFATVDGPVKLAYDTGASPTRGKGYGPKPGSWLVWEGYPTVTIVDGVWSSSRHILEGSLDLITTVIGKAGSDIAAKSSETPGWGTVTAWYNNAGPFAATTFTFTGYNFSASAITASKYVVFNLVNGIWVAVFESCT